MDYDVEVIIIGAGVVGLAVGAELASEKLSVAIIERWGKYGLETSSRNSEVIHSGIHYPTASLKAQLCVEGNELIYKICPENNIFHSRTGKLTLATNEEETKIIEKLFYQGQANGVKGLEIYDRKKVKELEPEIFAYCALYTPSTGLVNAHQLMDYFANRFRERGGFLVLGSEVQRIEFLNDGWCVYMRKGPELENYKTKMLINCGGLNSDKIAEMAGVNIEKSGYKLHWCKGDYFSCSKKLLVKHLIYPVPEKAGLGIHLTPKLGGGFRFGPDTEYVERKNIPYPIGDRKTDFFVDDSKKENFFFLVKKYLPDFKIDWLEPEMYGIRAKLQGPEFDFRDFVIREEREKGLSGLINLIGIDSPGLTSAPAIGRYVRQILGSGLEI